MVNGTTAKLNILMLFWVLGCKADAACANDTTLSSANGTVTHSSQKGSCKWKWHTGKNYSGIFLRMEKHSLTYKEYNKSKCVGYFHPTGDGKELRSCEWKVPTCYIFTRNKTDCASYIAKKTSECEYITRFVEDLDVPRKVSFRLNGEINETGNMTFYYEFFHCNPSEENIPGHESIEQAAIVALSVAGFFILLFAILTLVTIAIRKRNPTTKSSMTPGQDGCTDQHRPAQRTVESSSCVFPTNIENVSHDQHQMTDKPVKPARGNKTAKVTSMAKSKAKKDQTIDEPVDDQLIVDQESLLVEENPNSPYEMVDRLSSEFQNSSSVDNTRNAGLKQDAKETLSAESNFKEEIYSKAGDSATCEFSRKETEFVMIHDSTYANIHDVTNMQRGNEFEKLSPQEYRNTDKSHANIIRFAAHSSQGTSGEELYTQIQPK